MFIIKNKHVLLEKFSRFILDYQENLTKFCILKPLRTKTAEEVGQTLIGIFCFIGIPAIIQTDNGREFKNKVFLHFKALIFLKRSFIYYLYSISANHR